MKSRAADLSDLETFIQLGRSLHASDPLWIPPLDDVLRRDLAGQGTFGRYAALQMYLCESAGRVVGRLAAIHNPRLPHVGQLGYFEAEDDPGVLRSLLDLAGPWLRERGATELWGPIEGGAHRTHRFMTRGFELEPFLFEPRNPPHYPALFEAAGFEPFHRWGSYELPVPDVIELLARLQPLVRRGLERYTRFIFERGDPDILPRLHRILDAVWRGHVGYAPLDLEEFVEAYAGLIALDPCPYLGTVHDAAGTDLGLGLCYPDYAAQVREIAGDAARWASWVGTAKKPRRLILHTVAAVPSARRRGIPYLILDYAAGKLAEDDYREVVVALVDEGFRFFGKRLAPTREYALFRRAV